MNSLLFIPYFPIVFLNYPPLLCGGQKYVVHGHVIYPLCRKEAINLCVERNFFKETKYE